MKLKFTHPVPEKGYQAGLIYDVPPQEVQKYLEADVAIHVHDSEEIIEKQPKQKKAAEG